MGCAPSRASRSGRALPPDRSTHGPSSINSSSLNGYHPLEEYESELSQRISTVRETATTASLVNSDDNSLAFHGLLLGQTRPALQYESTIPGNETQHPSVALHPNDDSFSAPLSYDPKYGVLTLSDVVMTLRYTVIISDNPEHEGYVRKIVHDVLDLVNCTLNGWYEGSEISKLNVLKPEKEATISHTLLKMFEIVDELHEATDGRFDPTCGVLKLAFSEALATAGRPPFPTEVNRFRFATGWKKRLTRKGNIVKKSNANTVIDFDGVSKGLCVDLICDALYHAGYESFYVDWAGDIRAVGCHPSGRPWRTAVMNPPMLPRIFKNWKDNTLSKMLTEDDVGYFVDLRNTNDEKGEIEHNVFHAPPGMSICTTGDYYQIRKYGYHHIVRTEHNTVMKATAHSTGSVSVLASTCAMADGIATAAMTFDGPEATTAFLERVMDRLPDKIFGYCVIGRDKKKQANNPSRRTAHFVPKVEAPANSANGVANGTSDASKAKQEPIAVPQVIFQCPGQLKWSDGFVDIDSLTPCSMNPDPIVSFLVPVALTLTCEVFSADAAVRAESTERLEFSYVFGDTSNSSAGRSSIRFMLNICEVYAFESIAVVMGCITEVSHGPADSVLAVMAKRSVRIQLPHSIMDEDHLHKPIIQQAKERFLEIPSSVCIITCTGADGNTYGFTATSLVLPEHAPGILCFNVIHSSTFFAAFGGTGSPILVYPLAEGSTSIAKRFANNALVQNDMKLRLGGSSTCVLKAMAVHMESFQDHAIVLAEINNLRTITSGNKKNGLVWLRKKYTSL